MLKRLITNEIRQLWLALKPSGADEPPANGQTPIWQARKGGADDRVALGNGNCPSFWPTSQDVLATARAATGM